MWEHKGILYGILVVPRNIVMDFKNVMQSQISQILKRVICYLISLLDLVLHPHFSHFLQMNNE